MSLYLLLEYTGGTSPNPVSQGRVEQVARWVCMRGAEGLLYVPD